MCKTCGHEVYKTRVSLCIRNVFYTRSLSLFNTLRTTTTCAQFFTRLTPLLITTPFQQLTSYMQQLSTVSTAPIIRIPILNFYEKPLIISRSE